MTQAKKLKKAIRARARKTGERYAAARRQVLDSRRKKETPRPAAPAKPTPAPAARPSRGGGLSDTAARKRTGRGLDQWFAVLDAFGAIQKGHTAAARHLSESHDVDGWYAQGITVAYERARGLRVANQRRSGSFEVSVSKVVDASVEEVADALGRADRRAAWLRGCEPALARGLAAALSGPGARTVKVRAGKDARLRYPAYGNTVEISITAKPGRRATVVAQVMKLASAQAVEAQRAAWRGAFASLQAHLAR